jgi:hypothetical protein
MMWTTNKVSSYCNEYSTLSYMVYNSMVQKYTWLKIIQYGGGEQNILNAEKFKYMQIKACCDSNASETDRISYLMFNVQKLCILSNWGAVRSTRVHITLTLLFSTAHPYPHPISPPTALYF